MGSFGKKALRFANKTNPHTWVMGTKASNSIDLGGQLLGAYDDNYKPEEITPPPSVAADQNRVIMARDMTRRLARKAQGRDSTIRASATAAPYTGQPAKLLGG